MLLLLGAKQRRLGANGVQVGRGASRNWEEAIESEHLDEGESETSEQDH